MSHVSAVHNRDAAAAFKEYGNTQHDELAGAAVSLEELQEAIVVRHSLGDAGLDEKQESGTRSQDFR